MAIPNGKPATDFSDMNREYIRAVAKEEAAAGGSIPAPENPSNGDVLTYNSTSAKWEATAPSGGGNVPTPDLEEDFGKTIVVGNDGYELQYPPMLMEIPCPITTDESISLPANSPIVFATVEADMSNDPESMALYTNATCRFIIGVYAVLSISQKIICNRCYTDDNTPNSIFFDIIIFRTDASATESIGLANNMIVTVAIESNE